MSQNEKWELFLLICILIFPPFPGTETDKIDLGHLYSEAELFQKFLVSPNYE